MRMMHSMEYDDEDKIDARLPIPCDKPDYPYNLRFSLTEKEFKKLPGIEPNDAQVGATFHFFGMAKVTSARVDENGCCVECQITELGIESEDEENQ